MEASTHAVALPVDAVLHDWSWPDAESDGSGGSPSPHCPPPPTAAERQQRRRLLSAPPTHRLHASAGRCWLGHHHERPGSTTAAERGPCTGVPPPRRGCTDSKSSRPSTPLLSFLSKPVCRSFLARTRRHEDVAPGRVVCAGRKAMPMREASVQSGRVHQSEQTGYWLRLSRPRSHKTLGKPQKDTGNEEPETEDSSSVSLKLAHRRRMCDWWRLFVVSSKADIKRRTADAEHITDAESEGRRTRQTRKKDAAVGRRQARLEAATLGQSACWQRHEKVQQRAGGESSRGEREEEAAREIAREQERQRFHVLAINDRYSLPEWRQLSRLPAHRRLAGHEDRARQESAPASNSGAGKGLAEALVAVLSARFEMARSAHRSECVWREATRTAAQQLLLQNRQSPRKRAQP